MVNKYYTIVPLGVKISYNHIVTSHPTWPNDNDYRGAIFATSLLLIICSSLAIVMRLVRSWKSQERIEWHDCEFFLIRTSAR
jgi:hypothetical protein